MAALRNLLARPSLFRGVWQNGRTFSTSSSVSLRKELANPIPPSSYQPIYWNYEIQELEEKSKGPWKDFNKEELQKMYEYYYRDTVEDESKRSGEWIRVTGAVMGIFGLSFWLLIAFKHWASSLAPLRRDANYRWHLKQKERDVLTRTEGIENAHYRDLKNRMEPDLERRREKARQELQLEERFRQRMEERLRARSE